MLEQRTVRIEKTGYIYRCVHRIMEGDCQCEHGPLYCEIGPLEADVYCVTNGMYLRFMRESGYEPENKVNYLKHWKNGRYADEDEDKPVVNISQNDARAYARFYGKRLPTEQEWQYLAAGPEHLKYPWGNGKDYSRCNVYGKCIENADSHSEGTSPFGLFNMCGNVWEYTDEIHDDGMHSFITLRGGSFYTAGNYWHAEGGAIPNDSHLKVHVMSEGMDRFETVGFRCVREVLG